MGGGGGEGVDGWEKWRLTLGWGGVGGGNRALSAGIGQGGGRRGLGSRPCCLGSRSKGNGVLQD